MMMAVQTSMEREAALEALGPRTNRTKAATTAAQVDLKQKER
jgi:hypothetical protein